MAQCEDCGSTTEKLNYGLCPYQEIHGIMDEVYLCDDCHHERAQDIESC